MPVYPELSSERATLAPAGPDNGRVHPDKGKARDAAPAKTHPTAPSLRKPQANRPATDDEILGLEQSVIPGEGRNAPETRNPSSSTPDEETDARREIPRPENVGPRDDDAAQDASAPAAEPENLRALFDANPDLRRAWHDARSYRETFATPEEARAATAVLADLDRMDALFYSRRPEDHAELARAVANLDPAAFASLAQAMNALAPQGSASVGARHAVPGAGPWHVAAQQPPPRSGDPNAVPNGPTQPRTSAGHGSAMPLQQNESSQFTPAQAEFFHAANAAAVEGVLDAIESQVERLLPEGVSKSARHRVVGEIYRELDTTLRSNRQLAQQMREAFASGALDPDHQRAIVSLVTGRARQALPGVAKRVLNEWTSTIVAANQDRRARQRAAERRVDIAGSGGAGNDGRRSLSPRDLDYARLSDADILNL